MKRINRWLINGVIAYLSSMLLGFLSILAVIILNLMGLNVTAVDLGLRRVITAFGIWIILNQLTLDNKN